MFLEKPARIKGRTRLGRFGVGQPLRHAAFHDRLDWWQPGRGRLHVNHEAVRLQSAKDNDRLPGQAGGCDELILPPLECSRRNDHLLAFRRLRQTEVRFEVCAVTGDSSLDGFWKSPGGRLFRRIQDIEPYDHGLAVGGDRRWRRERQRQSLTASQRRGADHRNHDRGSLQHLPNPHRRLGFHRQTVTGRLAETNEIPSPRPSPAGSFADQVEVVGLEG